MRNEAIKDTTVYGTRDEPLYLVPHTCPCCKKCWKIIAGKGTGRCVWGGPYLGYVEVPE